MDLNDVKDLLTVLQELDFSEFELEHEGWKLRLRRGAEGVAVARLPQAGGGSAGGTQAATSGEVAGLDGSADDSLIVVKSPMVGTFYRAANPESPVFVNVGERIEAGQVLCIIEAMKLMNEIEAEEAGEVVRILVENGQAVQYGDPLFAIRTA